MQDAAAGAHSLLHTSPRFLATHCQSSQTAHTRLWWSSDYCMKQLHCTPCTKPCEEVTAGPCRRARGTTPLEIPLSPVPRRELGDARVKLIDDVILS
jgi:hypothetical protein